jgi:hypothetical protein
MFCSAKALSLLGWHEMITPPKPEFASLLSLEGRRWRDRLTPRASLQDHSGSAFKTMLDSNNDQALLNACGHDHASFQCLVDLFEPVHDSHFLGSVSGFTEPVVPSSTGKRKGRPRHLDSAGCLGLVLMMHERRCVTVLVRDVWSYPHTNATLAEVWQENPALCASKSSRHQNQEAHRC